MASDLHSVTITIRTEWCDQGAHVVFDFNRREHDTDGLDCWCGALTYSAICDECDVGCWKCEGGSIRLTREQAEHADVPLIIVHN